MSIQKDAREAIVVAALPLFAQFGFKKTSIDDIAARAHVGKGTVYLHFASKEELFAEIVHRVSDQLLRTLKSAVEQAPTPETKLWSFVKVRVEEVAILSRRYGLSDDAALEIIPMVEELRKEFLDREVDLLERILVEAKDSGKFEIRNPRLFAIGVLALLTGIEITLIRLRKPPDVTAALEEIFAVNLRGLCSGTERKRSSQHVAEKPGMKTKPKGL